MVQLTAWMTALLAGVAVGQTYPPDVVDILAGESLPKLKEYLAKHPQGSCTYETAVKRREWLVQPRP
jgi:tyrosinase